MMYPTMEMCLRISISMAACWLTISAGFAEDFRSQLPRIASSTPRQSLDSMSVAKGFVVDLAASEPMVSSPVEICWDDRGRMYVCEMRGYSEHREERLSRISRLEDRDGDGTYETSIVFADGLLWPTAIFAYRNGLFVADAPNIWFMSDQDDDGRSDGKELVLTGFGTHNVQGLLNSFRWGLDNRIHVACSSNGGKIHRPGSDQTIDVRGRDLAFHPKTYEFSTTTGGSQHGMSFDDWGRKFLCSNSDHIQSVMIEDRYLLPTLALNSTPSKISIAADGPQAEVYRKSPVEPWRVVRTRLRVSGLARGPVEGGGRAAGYFTGATGVTIYRGSAWPKQFIGMAIVGDVGGNLIHRKQIRYEGLVPIAERIDEASEFIAATDNWFRPAQFSVGPDGNLYVVDMCREVIEHPASLPAEIKMHLDLDSGRDRGRIFRVRHEHGSPATWSDFSNPSQQKLAELLGHPNAWHRETASRIIFENQDPSIEADLRNLLRSGQSERGRLHALCALDGIQSLTPELIIQALNDPSEMVRRQAIRLAEKFPSTHPHLASRLDDPSVFVRYQLAWSLSKVKLPERVDWLAHLIESEKGVPWIESAILTAVGTDAPELFARLLERSTFQSPSAFPFLMSLSDLVIKDSDELELQKVTRSLLSLPSDDAFLFPLLSRVTDSLHSKNPTEDSTSHHELLAQATDRSDRIIERLIAQTGNEELDVSKRVHAASALQYANANQTEINLVRLLKQGTTSQLTTQILRTLTTAKSSHLADQMSFLWPKWLPEERRTALDLMIRNRQQSISLIRGIEDGTISTSELSRSQWQSLAKSGVERVREYAKAHLSNHPLADRTSVLAKYQPAIRDVGDIEKGKIIFGKHCANCHRIGETGHEVGPNLISFATRGKPATLVNILDPNREVNPQYLRQVLLTEDGEVISGIIRSESAGSLQIQMENGKQLSFARAEIQEIRGTGQSLMPEGLEENIDVGQMTHLLTYLDSLAPNH